MPLDPIRVQAVFGAAIGCDADEDRAMLLDRECSTDPELRRRVEALLGAHDQADSLLDRPIVRVDFDQILPEAGPEEGGLEPEGAVSPVGASDGSDPTIGLPAADVSFAGHATGGHECRPPLHRWL